MKKVILLFLAFLASFALTELVIGNLFAYPAFGVSQKARYRKGGAVWSNIRQAHARVFNVENRTFTKYNNYGLPGNEIVNLDNPVVFLGDSQIEALQHSPEKIASSVFENKLREADPSYDVINLGSSGHDPYDLYFRLKFFERRLGFKTENVILLISRDAVNWFARHPKPFNFEQDGDFGQINDHPVMNLQIKLRNASSLLELLIQGLIKGKAGENDEEARFTDNWNKEATDFTAVGISKELRACLSAFEREYADFLLVSMSADLGFNLNLEKLCVEQGIELISVPVLKPEYLIGGAGHLNEKGNRFLGVELAKKYITIQANPR